jgi:hypothetical protein
LRRTPERLSASAPSPTRNCTTAASVRNPGRAEQDRHEGECDVAGVHAQHQQHAAHQFRGEGEVAECRRQAERDEELRRARQREDVVLEQRVGDEHDAEADAQQQRAELDAGMVGSVRVRGHGGLLFGAVDWVGEYLRGVS